MAQDIVGDGVMPPMSSAEEEGKHSLTAHRPPVMKSLQWELWNEYRDPRTPDWPSLDERSFSKG